MGPLIAVIEYHSMFEVEDKWLVFLCNFKAFFITIENVLKELESRRKSEKFQRTLGVYYLKPRIP